MSGMLLEDFANEMSEILLGYREGSCEQMLEKAEQVMEVARNHQVQQNLTALLDHISYLKQIADDIESDA